jgi:hypothetical protein
VIIEIDATLLTIRLLMSMSGTEEEFRIGVGPDSVWGGRSTFSEADIQIKGLQWNRMYFGNAAEAACHV